LVRAAFVVGNPTCALPRDLEKVLRMTLLPLILLAFGRRGADDRVLRLHRPEYGSDGVGLHDEALRTVGHEEVDIFSARCRAADFEGEGRRGGDGAGEMAGITRIRG